MLKVISKLGDKVTNYATKMEESDQWFEDKTFVVDNLDQQLRKLLMATEAMVDFRLVQNPVSLDLFKSCATVSPLQEEFVRTNISTE